MQRNNSQSPTRRDRNGSPSPHRARSPSPKRVAGLLGDLIGSKPSSPSYLNSGSPMRFDKVKKNSKGGVLVTMEDIQTAFSLLDVDKHGQITLPGLKKRLGPLFPEMTAKEYRFLLNNKKEMTIDELKELLVDNEVSNFDPVAEAFKIFDPKGEGSIDPAMLRTSFASFGFGEITDEEYDILKRAADVDGDGHISIDDFRLITEGNQRSKSVVLKPL